MSRSWKIVLIILGSLVALGVGGIGICSGIAYCWWDENAAGIIESSRATQQEGATAGQGRTPEQCFDLALGRLDQCGQMDIMCVSSVNLYAQGCFDTCAQDPSYCQGVPPPTDFIGTATWGVSHCDSVGRRNDERCPNLASVVQRYCALMDVRTKQAP